MASGAWRTCSATGAAAILPLSNGRERWQLTLRLEPAREGPADLQPAPLTYAEGTGPEPTRVTWRPIPVQVTTAVARAERSELRDITPIEAVPPGQSWQGLLSWFVAAIVLSILGASVLFLQRRRRLRQAAALPPDRWALRELQRLEASGLPAAVEVEPYYRQVSDLVRHYLEVRFQLRASRQTTAEFLDALPQSPQLTPVLQTQLRELLERCDLAKFARAPASAEECRRVAELARRFVEQTACPVDEARPTSTGTLQGQPGAQVGDSG
jgi:hypothetical protein